MNNGKYHTEEYKRKQEIKNDRLYGPVTQHIKVCEKCNDKFTWTGRKKTKSFKQARFCSRSCANHRGNGLEHKRPLTFYVSICFAHFEKKCIHCGHDKIVSVHHLDENRKNNDVRNLVPLCMNCHMMIHKKEYKEEVEDSIQNWIPLREQILMGNGQ